MPSTSAVVPPLVSQWRVLHALILRDIRTRFFGNGLGYLLFIAWPLAHMAILLGIYWVTGRTVPYGDSIIRFFAAGLIPIMSFQYMSRFIMMSAIINKPLLAFPAVTVMDILIARAMLEALAACCYSIILLLAMWVGGLNALPLDYTQAFLAMAASLLLGFGFGCVNGVITSVFPMWVTGYTLILIVAYISSGVVFVPSGMPEIVRSIMSYNPILHGVEWMRIAYIPGYPTDTVSKTYLVLWGIASVSAAFVSEKASRRLRLRS